MTSAVQLFARVAVLAAAGVLGRAGWQHLRDPRPLAASVRQLGWVAARSGGVRLTRTARAWGGSEAVLALAVAAGTVAGRPDLLRPAAAGGTALMLAYAGWLTALRRTTAGATCACTGRSVPVGAATQARAGALAAMFGCAGLLGSAPPWLGAGENPAVALVCLLAAAAIGVLLWILPDAMSGGAMSGGAVPAPHRLLTSDGGGR